MLLNDKRHCDICEKEIAKGDRFTVHRIARWEVPFAVAGLDHQGDFRLDICLSCRDAMGLVSGDEVVN